MVGEFINLDMPRTHDKPYVVGVRVILAAWGAAPTFRPSGALSPLVSREPAGHKCANRFRFSAGVLRSSKLGYTPRRHLGRSTFWTPVSRHSR